jgi:hypothetical protein
LSWTDNASNKAGITIDINKDGNFWKAVTLGANATSYDVGGLQPGTQYSFDLDVGYVGAGDDAKSLAVTTNPLAPSNLQASAITAQSVTLSWTDSSSIETGFRIAISSDGGATWQNVGAVGANANSFQVTGLKNAASYMFKVRAVDGSLFSDYSNVVSVRTTKK